MRTKILNKSFGVVEFQAESSFDITEEAAIKAQLELGYHPAGYGFYNFRVTRDPILFRSKATWECNATCE